MYFQLLRHVLLSRTTFMYQKSDDELNSFSKESVFFHRFLNLFLVRVNVMLQKISY